MRLRSCLGRADASAEDCAHRCAMTHAICLLQTRWRSAADQLAGRAPIESVHSCTQGTGRQGQGKKRQRLGHTRCRLAQLPADTILCMFHVQIGGTLGS